MGCVQSCLTNCFTRNRRRSKNTKDIINNDTVVLPKLKQRRYAETVTQPQRQYDRKINYAKKDNGLVLPNQEQNQLIIKRSAKVTKFKRNRIHIEENIVNDKNIFTSVVDEFVDIESQDLYPDSKLNLQNNTNYLMQINDDNICVTSIKSSVNLDEQDTIVQVHKQYRNKNSTYFLKSFPCSPIKVTSFFEGCIVEQTQDKSIKELDQEEVDKIISTNGQMKILLSTDDKSRCYYPIEIAISTNIPFENRFVNYTLGKNIGSGGFGLVSVVSTKDGKHQALKDVKVENSMTYQEFRSNRNEIIQYMRLKEHSAIVDVQDIFMWNNNLAFVMELCPSGNLEQFSHLVEYTQKQLEVLKELKRDQQDEIDDSNDYSYDNDQQNYSPQKYAQDIKAKIDQQTEDQSSIPQLLRYIAQLNERGIGEEMTASIVKVLLEQLQYFSEEMQCFLDLKLENILIDKEGRIKICDLGMVTNLKLDMGQSDPSVLVPLPSRMGTKALMSPEMVEHKSCNIRTDIWTIGMMIQQMLTGELFLNKYAHQRFALDGSKQLDQFDFQKAWKDIDSGHIQNILRGQNMSENAASFVNRCLQLDFEKRADCKELLEHPWLHKFIPNDSLFDTEQLDFVSKHYCQYIPLENEHVNISQ